MREYIVSFWLGLLFAIGLGLSEMTKPEKIIHFLDFFGAWDPSLIFVMAGAILVYGTGIRLIKGRCQAWFGATLHRQVRSDLPFSLFVGAGMFGVGWGLVGLCPGPVLVSSVIGAFPILLFLVSMLVAIALFPLIQSRISFSKVVEKHED